MNPCIEISNGHINMSNELIINSALNQRPAVFQLIKINYLLKEGIEYCRNEHWWVLFKNDSDGDGAGEASLLNDPYNITRDNELAHSRTNNFLLFWCVALLLVQHGPTQLPFILISINIIINCSIVGTKKLRRSMNESITLC